ncbi:MAG: SurA N-terminal domain-containing protein [Crocinitomicaceae bacterium]|nr:SurA N-terminal domain-containing protein [Crocinitomicaceae bacterium]
MALIGKIRDKSWLILIIIGGALAAFILGDFLKMDNGQELQYGYGTVYDEMVDFDGFADLLSEAQENAQRQKDQEMAQQGYQPGTVPADPVDQSLVWNQFVQNIVLEREYEALGITVSDAEFDAYLFGTDGFEAPTELQQQFTDSSGMFSPNMLRAKIEELENSESVEDQQIWEQSRRYYIDRRRQEKYFSILSQGVYVTNLEAEQEYLAQKEIKSIAYIMQRYSDIPDEEIEVTDEDLLAYFEEHKEDAKYRNRTSSREVRFFDVLIQPSASDSADFNKDAEKIIAEFAVAENDSLFVMNNSEVQIFTSSAFSTILPDRHPKAQQHLTYPTNMEAEFANAQIGDVIGPYDYQEMKVIAKIIGFTQDTINARHILLRIEPGQEAIVEARADSILNVINDGNFEEYVNKYSTDEGSKIEGGDLGDFFFSDMVQPFAMFCADKPIGEIGKVTSQFGIHIIQVTDRRGTSHPRVAIIQKTFESSAITMDSTAMEVENLIFKLNDDLADCEDEGALVALFDTVVSQAGPDYSVRPITIEENSPKVYGFESKVSEDKILELAFREGAMVGDLIDSPIKEGNRYILAILSAIKEEGAPKFEDVEAAIRRDFIREEKVKRLTAQMTNAESMASLEKKLGVLAVKADVTFGNTSLQGAGAEPKIMGAIFSGIPDGTRTMPLEGNQGVFIVQIESSQELPVATTYDEEKLKLLTDNTRNLQGAATNALVKQAKVVDNRRFFDYNIRR